MEEEKHEASNPRDQRGRLVMEVTDVELKNKCTNTIQSRILVVDDNGFRCLRKDLDRNGCCTTRHQRFSCEYCDLINKCCRTYENCVSCCLNPKEPPALGSLHLSRYPLQDSDFTRFERCQMACRTSSLSLLHENTYRSPLKHCFADKPPPLIPP
ncbi:hypothetical protein PROFUN_03992 [Planoprotostelium fungivorum]|uniref:SREBP regulating gene protein n=1 Tax=Planoprotostelium fungivorum TaxID=1890364 RepID=A0A2P6NW34_9EUKA|nr:hypothetical protein PROFUN_03992 [Planoprotostelium fungivorum]